MKAPLLLYRIVRSLQLLFPFSGHAQLVPAPLWQQRLTAIRIVLVATAMLAPNLLAQAQINAGTVRVGDDLDFYHTQPVVDSRSSGKVTSLPSPLGGTIGFSNELDIFNSSNAPSWGNGYSGRVYANSRITSITLTLPVNTKAFYLYARANYFPNLSGQTGGSVTATATTQKGYTASASQRVAFGDTEAKVISFSLDNATNNADNVRTITVTLDFPGANLYIGQFGIYQCDPIPTRVLASNDGVLTCDNSTLRLTTPDVNSFFFRYEGPNNFYKSGYSGEATGGLGAIVSEPGTYTATVDQIGGCPAIGTITITEDKTRPTDVTFTNDGPLTCKKPAVTLRASSTNGAIYDFYGRNGFHQSGAAATASVTTPGSYELYVKASNGCPSNFLVTDVTADTAPPADVTLTTSGTITCSQPTVQLTATSSTPNVTYSFSGPGTIKASGNMATVNQGGTYQVTVTNTNGCTTVSSTTVASRIDLTSVSQPLYDLYNATGGANWTNNTNWLTTCDVCGWYGVTCTNGRVTGLNLINNNLSGTLPTSLSTLTSLQSLELGANALTGGIPTGIGSLTALQTLNLSRTQLGGAIPASLGGLTRLQNLLLNESALTGSLPASLGGLGQLQNLQLYANQLGGCFPGSYTALCGRSQISFANNPNLTGEGDFGAFCTNGTGIELVVSQYPQSGNACEGNPFSFSVVARGAGSYQWYKLGPGQFQQLAESGPILRFASVSSADAGNYQVYINYSCRPGAVQSDVVTLTVPQPGTGGCAQLNTAPTATANASQTAIVGRAFSYTVNAFTDAESPNGLTYAALFGQASSGLSFEAATRVISGTPSEPGPVSVTITATDAGGLSASTSFTIGVGPRMVSASPLRVTLTASPQTLLTSGSTQLRATASGGTPSASPGGYSYRFIGPGDFATSQANEVTVTNLPAGVLTFTVVVTDASIPTSQTISATVSVTVSAANTAPTVASALPSQSATVGQEFSYVIPATTFTDAQTPNSLSLSVSGLPSGLRFTAPATLSGTPSASGTSTVAVTATDPGSLSTSTSFVLTVRPAPVVVTPLALTLTASPATLPVSGSTTLSATVSGGTAPYRFSFTGPGTITQNTSSNTARVASLPAGVQTFTVAVSDATQPTSQSITKTVSVTVSAPAATTALRVLHQDADNNLANNAIKPNLQISNTGAAPISYGQLTLRYWLTVEQFSPLTNLQVYYAQLGTDKVKMSYVALDKPRQGAFGYVEYRFDRSAGSLAAGASSGPIQSGIAKQDYTAFNEADDYSFAPNQALTANSRVTAYLNGQLVWGTEPAEVASQRIVKAYTENKNGTSTNTIGTFLQVRNEGNVALSYSDLKVRYYFTSEGSQPLNFYVDYAMLGNQKVKGQFGRLSPPLASADMYLELSFDASLGTFNPGSSTGNIQYRIAKQDWSNFSQSNDYSYQNGTSPLAENGRVVVYVGSQRVYGTEPGAGGRIAAEEVSPPLTVTLLSNPVRDNVVSVQIKGAGEEPLQLQLISAQGRVITQQQIANPQVVEQHDLSLTGQGPGVFLLQVSTPTQTRTVRVLKAE